MATPDDDDYNVVSFAKMTKSSAKSVPLFLPSNLKHDAKKNTISEVKQNGNGSDSYPLVLVPNAGADILQKVGSSPISCISCVGPYRTGKSLLMSRFLKDSAAFRVGPTLEGCTRGIWISTSAIVDDDSNCHTFLLDCEGAGDPLESDEAANARIALACILISTIFLFNNTGRPDRGSLQFLSYLTTIRKRLPTPVDSSAVNNRNFPSFLWIFRDFFLKLPVRKDTGKPYTLQEYMMERVLVANGSGNNPDDSIVDSLLNDFASMDVAKVGYPSKGDESFTPDEMSRLDEIPWEEFDEEYRKDVAQIIALCRSKAKPFTLSATSSADDKTVSEETPATGPIFVQWCAHVLDLVNSDTVIPNLPDLQHQLLQSIADAEVTKAAESYKEQMQAYLDGCPVFNNSDGNDSLKALVGNNNLKGVADDADLVNNSDMITADLAETMKKAIASPSLSEMSIERFKSMSTNIESDLSSLPSLPRSVLSRMLETNEKRSENACMALARSVYFALRENLRNDATNISQDDFENMVKNVITTFRTNARGPAVEGTIATFIMEQQEADVIFLEKVHGIHSLYEETLQEKEVLDKTVQETKIKVESLELAMEETKEQHAKSVADLLEKSKEKMQELTENHMTAMEDAIAEQQSIQESKLDEMAKTMNNRLDSLQEEREADLKAKEEEMENLKQDAELKLTAEISARDENLRKTEQSHEQQIQNLLEVADEKMKSEIMAAEDKRKKEISAFNNEMTSKLKEAEEQMRLEVEEREQRLREEKEKHSNELEQTKLALLKDKEEERERYMQQIDELNNRCLNTDMCMMM